MFTCASDCIVKQFVIIYAVESKDQNNLSSLNISLDLVLKSGTTKERASTAPSWRGKSVPSVWVREKDATTLQ